MKGFEKNGSARVGVLSRNTTKWSTEVSINSGVQKLKARVEISGWRQIIQCNSASLVSEMSVEAGLTSNLSRKTFELSCIACFA